MARDQRKGNKGKNNARNNNFTGVEIHSAQCDCGKYSANVSVQYVDGIRQWTDCSECNGGDSIIQSFVPVEMEDSNTNLDSVFIDS